MALTLNQTGLSAGTIDRSRSDGLSTGALIQITSSISSSVTMLWRPDRDTTSVLSAIDSTHWELTPPANAYGSYLFNDPASDSKRVFTIRTPNRGIRIPALNEGANVSGSLLNNSAPYIFESDFNEVSSSGPFTAGNYGGWYSAWRELALIVDSISRTTADDQASYLTLNATSSLVNERVFSISGTLGLRAVDNGSSLTLSIDNGIVATVTGTNFTGIVSASAGLFARGLQLTASAPPVDQIIVKGWTSVSVTGTVFFMPLFQ